MIYGIQDKPKTAKEWILYTVQLCLSVWVATVLIARICNTPVNSCLIGACLGTLVYQFLTGFKSPMFISSCGATSAAVIGALALGNCGQNYLAVALGGLILFLVYAIFAVVIKAYGIKSINKIFPPTIVGAVTIVIGLNLAAFIPTYVQINGEQNQIGVYIAVITMLVIAVSSHYFKGFLRTIPFLLGLLVGYGISLILTTTGVCNIIDLSAFKGISLFSIPDLSFMHWTSNVLNWDIVVKVALLFVPVSICALLEHYSDHKVLSNIIGTDLTEEPGLYRTLLGDGFASFIGTIVCGLPNTSYGESIATIGFSKVASVYVTTASALTLGVLAFLTPVQVFISTIPSCVFGGCAMVLYGFIAASGLKTLFNNKVDLENNKNLVIVSVILTIGVSGIYLFSESLTGVAFAMIAGVVLNLILKEKTEGKA